MTSPRSSIIPALGSPSLTAMPEQVNVMRHCLQDRLGAVLHARRPVTAWLLGVSWRSGGAFSGAERGVLKKQRHQEDELRDSQKKEQVSWEGHDDTKKTAHTITGILAQGDARILGMSLKEAFSGHLNTTGCPGCRVLIRKVAPQSHSEDCREIMEALLRNSEAGFRRKRLADDRTD